jgi:hypothetical protein
MNKDRGMEAWIALILLIVSIFTGNALWAIAAGAFAIATDV